MHFLQPNRTSQQSDETTGVSAALANGADRPSIPNRNSRRDKGNSREGADSEDAISDSVSLPSFAFTRYSASSTDWPFKMIVSFRVVGGRGVIVVVLTTVSVAS